MSFIISASSRAARFPRFSRSSRLFPPVSRISAARWYSLNDSPRIELSSYDSESIRVVLKDPRDSVTSADGFPVSFRHFFLRDAATDAESVDPFSGQKLFSSGQIPLSVKPCSVQVISKPGEPDSLEVLWAPNSFDPKVKKTVYSFDFLKSYASLKARRARRHLEKPPVTWDGPLIRQTVANIRYSDYVSDGAAVLEALQSLHYYGLAFISGIPPQELTPDGTQLAEPILVENLASRVGNIKETFYGKSWDVRSVPEATNIAYTDSYLPLHMDLLYYESPPGLQYLHCVANEAQGGDSVFADSFRAVETIAEEDPEAYKALCKVPVTYHYDRAGQHYYQARPVVVEDVYGVRGSNGRLPVKAVNYSPPFQGPFEYAVTVGEGAESQEKGAVFAAFHRGLQRFEELINDEKNQLEMRLEAGTCVVFMNRRTLHCRRSFDSSSGVRWLRGTYSDVDTFYSKLRVLEEKFKR